MTKAYGLPIVSVQFISDDTANTVNIGDTIQHIGLRTGYTLDNVVLRGVEFDAHVNQHSQSGTIYDSVPINGYQKSYCGLLKADSSDFDVSRIVVERKLNVGSELIRIVMNDITNIQFESEETIQWKNDTNSSVIGIIDGVSSTEIEHCTIDTATGIIELVFNTTNITDFGLFDSFLAIPGMTKFTYRIDDQSFSVDVGSNEQNTQYDALKKGVQNTMPTTSGETKNGAITMENATAKTELVYTLKVQYYNEAEVVAKIGDKAYDSIESAIADAKAGDTIVLQKAIEVDNTEVSDVVTNGVFNLPAGVMFDGGNFTITAKEDTWVGDSAQNHIFTITAGTSKISNVTIIGHAKAKSGVLCYGVGTTATLENVTVQNMGNVGVQVAGANVTMTNVNTSGNAWGGINVDKGSDGSMPYVTYNSGTMEENVELYTEITDQDVVTAEGLMKYQGFGDTLKGFIFYTSDVNRLGKVMVGTDKIYETLNLAVASKSAEQMTLLTNVTEDVTVPVGSNLKLNGATKETTIFGTITCEAAGAENSAIELSQLTLDGQGKKEFGIRSQNQTDNDQMELTMALYGIVIQNYTSKGIYATNVKKMGYSGVLMQDCATGDMNEPNTKGDYAIDLNLVAVQDASININNSYFRGDLGDKAIIKVAQRGGASDADAADIPKGVGESNVKQLLVSGSEFNSTTPIAVQVGSSSKTAGDVVNSTAKFLTKVMFNDQEIKINVATFTDTQGELVVPVGRDAIKNPDDDKFSLVPTPEEVVDDALNNMEGVDVVDEGDNTFSITTSDGTISDSGLFDKMAEIENLNTIVVKDESGHIQTFTAGGDLEAFKTSVDEMLPKDIGSGTVVLTMTVNLK